MGFRERGLMVLTTRLQHPTAQLIKTYNTLHRHHTVPAHPPSPASMTVSRGAWRYPPIRILEAKHTL